MLPVAYIAECFVIRRLCGESLDYAVIATCGVLGIVTDLIKLVWGTTPYPVNDPIGLAVPLGGLDLPVYRFLIVISAVLLFLALGTFFQAIHYRPDHHRLFGGQRRGALPGA
jgi:branched-chain amino acid transport system permease protein